MKALLLQKLTSNNFWGKYFFICETLEQNLIMYVNFDMYLHTKIGLK